MNRYAAIGVGGSAIERSQNRQRKLDGIVTFLVTNAESPYKSVAKELDARYRKVASFRKAAKKALTDIEPVTRKLIPRLKKTTTAAPEEKPTATSFPSGRSVILPRLTGQWAVSGSSTSAMFSSGSPFTTMRSATAPSSIIPSFPG